MLMSPLTRLEHLGISLALFALVLSPSALARADEKHPPAPAALHIATVDSGFGGFFTAKSIESATPELLKNYNATITIKHYGDTRNAPYAEKTPEKIAELGSNGIIKAFREGADIVFLACNTASIQYDKIKQTVAEVYPEHSGDVVSIIDASAVHSKKLIDQKLTHAREAHFAILATPATVKSMVYPRELAKLYGVKLKEEDTHFLTQPRWFKEKGDTVQSATQKSEIHLADGKTIYIYQMAPANWVEMIEHGADLSEKNQAIKRDMAILFSMLPDQARLDLVGYFCTHFPAFDSAIRMEVAHRQPGSAVPAYIAQGALMADIFKSRAEARLKDAPRMSKVSPEQLDRLIAQSRASITISGNNAAITRQLSRSLFPNDPEPKIIEDDFAPKAIGKPAIQ